MVYRESLKLQSRDRAVSFHDVTQQVKEIAAKSGMKNGICVVYSHHTTCSVITQECAFDMSMTGLETLQQDLVNVFEEWIPTCRYEGMYLHPAAKRWTLPSPSARTTLAATTPTRTCARPSSAGTSPS